MLTTILAAMLAGGASAAALPVGAASGLAWRPGARVTSSLLAFGAGALLFALSVEIVADSLAQAGFLPLAAGALTGGALFQAADHLLSSRGAFLRNVSRALGHLAREKRLRADALLERLARVELLQGLEPDQLARLVPAVRTCVLPAGEDLFRERQPGEELFLIDSGVVAVSRDGVELAVLGPGDVVGEMALVTGAPRSATVSALSDVTLLAVPRASFDAMIHASPGMRASLRDLFTSRTEHMQRHVAVPCTELEQWRERATRRLHDQILVTRADVEEAAARRGAQAARTIWLGNLLDAVPGSLVLGTTVGTTGLSWPLFAGIILANWPEALSSSRLMRASGMRPATILGMWTSIVPVAALSAAAGSLFISGLSAPAFGFIEGVAAGAMLVMIAETMLPEAFDRGGAGTGLATLLGFLAALGVKAAAP